MDSEFSLNRSLVFNKNLDMNANEEIDPVPEPQWILDKSDSGPLHWRRESPRRNSRVRFRVDVEVKEFHRGAHELEDANWSECIQEVNTLSMGLTCFLCIAVTVMLPWYIIVGSSLGN